MKYAVSIKATITDYHVVEADSEDDAIDKALDALQNSVTDIEDHDTYASPVETKRD